MPRKFFIVTAFLFVLILLPLQNSASADVKVYNSIGQFVGVLVSVEIPLYWIIYNPELERLIRINPSNGQIALSDTVACPYYDSDNSCDTEPYLHESWGTWLIRCNNRYFMATTFDTGQVVFNEDSANSQLYQDGSCHADISSFLPLFPAREIASADLPFEMPYGALSTEYVPSDGGGGDIVMKPTVQEVPAPAITPNGILMLATLMAGAGYFAIRRRKK
jgi:hypothetical protein